MANATPMLYWNPAVQTSQPRSLKLVFTLTAAKTVTDTLRTPTLTTFDGYASQSVIDTFLGTTNEFLLAAFDATAMGADTFAGIVNLGGQCAEVISMSATCYSASNTIVTRYCEDSATLTASTLGTELAKGANGNVAFKVDFGNIPDFDLLTAGTIEIDITWRSK